MSRVNRCQRRLYGGNGVGAKGLNGAVLRWDRSASSSGNCHNRRLPGDRDGKMKMKRSNGDLLRGQGCGIVIPGNRARWGEEICGLNCMLRVCELEDHETTTAGNVKAEVTLHNRRADTVEGRWKVRTAVMKRGSGRRREQDVKQADAHPESDDRSSQISFCHPTRRLEADNERTKSGAEMMEGSAWEESAAAEAILFIRERVSKEGSVGREA
ncbi:hypothetical protein C8R43DRAFT_962232 [Mycena crocata]|nr:hypothetical protein C8R43DRAFT_962232 [Mycena crocata]